MSKQKIGFVGIGIMGTAMVRRLLDRDYPMTVWNRNPERLQAVVAEGAVAAPSPAALASASDVVLMCLLDVDGAIDTVLFGAEGIATGGRPGQRVVDLSTTDPDATRRRAARLKQETGMILIDAPLSGGPDGARQGTMIVMAGGAADDIAAMRPLMADMTANFTHMGPSGAGQTTKMINQLMVGTGFAIMAEAVALAEAAGIDAAGLPAALKGGFADSSMLQRTFPVMQARAFDPPKSLADQMLKDMRALQDFAGRLGLALPMADLARERLAAHVAAGNGQRDPASMLELLKK